MVFPNDISQVLRHLREQNKIEENRKKPILVSNDVRKTKDFTFTSITTQDSEGDSGNLLLAQNKSDSKDRYLVKHAFTDCAANEFMYTKLVQAMDIKMPDAKLFEQTSEDQRTCFKTEYIIGCRFIDLLDKHPSYEYIMEHAKNWQDYYRYHALEGMFLESDGIEILLGTDEYIYRVDTTSSFGLNALILDQAGINQKMGEWIPKEFVKKDLLSRDFSNYWDYSTLDFYYTKFKNSYGDDCLNYYLEPFARIQEISDSYVDDSIHTLCYFYPDFIGDYYKLFIQALQKKSQEYLDSKK